MGRLGVDGGGEGGRRGSVGRKKRTGVERDGMEREPGEGSARRAGFIVVSRLADSAVGQGGRWRGDEVSLVWPVSRACRPGRTVSYRRVRPVCICFSPVRTVPYRLVTYRDHRPRITAFLSAHLLFLSYPGTSHHRQISSAVHCPDPSLSWLSGSISADHLCCCCCPPSPHSGACEMKWMI